MLQTVVPPTEIMEHVLLTQTPALNPEHPDKVEPEGQDWHV